MSDEKVWWYAKGDKRFGPHTSAELKSLAAAGQFGPNDMVWKEGLSDWLQASSVKGLFAASSGGIPPPLPGSSGATGASLGGATSSEKLRKMRVVAKKVTLWTAGVFIGLIVLGAIVGPNEKDKSSSGQQTSTIYERCEKSCKDSEYDCKQRNEYRSSDVKLGVAFDCAGKYVVCESRCAENNN